MTDAVDSQWWDERYEGKRHEPVTRVVRAIRQNQGYRKTQDLIHASLYANRPIAGFGIGSRLGTTVESSIALNVVRNMTGAVTSKIAAKNKPKPTFLPDGGTYDERELAERREKYVGGVFYETKLYAQLPKCFRDACVWGTGFLKVYVDSVTKMVAIDRVRAVEIVVDDMESMYGTPPNIYQRKYYDTLTAVQLWAKDDPELEKKIRAAAAKKDSEDAEYGYQTTADQVLVTEAWHTVKGKGQKGRHTGVLDGVDLFDEPWDGEHPFAVFRWSEDIEGFFGVGLAEELRGIQDEINTLLAQIQRGHHLIVGHYLVQKGGPTGVTLQTQHLNNDLASIVTYAGEKPDYQVPAIIAPEVYSHLWQLYAKAFEITGISQMNATGQKPAGLDSGIAQRTYQDIQTERFLEVGQNYEEFVMDVARLVVRVGRSVGGKHRVRSVDKESFEFVDASELGDGIDDAVIQVFPTSLLPTLPAGRMQWALDMMDRKAMPAEDLLEIAGGPDTKAFADRANAPRKLIERNVAHMLRTGEFVSPEPFDHHETALKLVNQEYAKARLDGVPDAKLELLRRYMTDTADFMKPPPQMSPPMPDTGAPPMPGAPPPMPGPPVGPSPPPMGPAMPAAA